MAFHNFLVDMYTPSLSDYGYLEVEGIFQMEDDSTFFLTRKTDKSGIGLNSKREKVKFSFEELKKAVQTEGLGCIDKRNKFIVHSKYEQFCKIAQELYETNSKEDKFKVLFELEGFLVTEGKIDKKSGKAELFGFNTTKKMWSNLVTDFSTKQSLESISYGSSVLNESGEIIGLDAKIGDVK